MSVHRAASASKAAASAANQAGQLNVEAGRSATVRPLAARVTTGCRPGPRQSDRHCWKKPRTNRAGGLNAIFSIPSGW
ncbi:hypothetical protein D3C85_1565010 [compost metagenome]